MTAQILDGKALARELRSELAQRVQELARRDARPGLAVVLVGDDPASQIYVRNKQRAAAEVGIESRLLHLPAGTAQADLLARIEELRADPYLHGILVQWPVPPQIDFAAVVAALGPEKDVDGFHPANLGALARGERCRIACTPRGILYLLERSGIPVAGRRAVIVGRSFTVGRPLGLLLLNADATVTLCHSKTRELAEITRQAEILVVAAGRAGLVDGSMVRPGAAVIDVGINRVNGELRGDVDFESVRQVAGWITPVPGGVGPLTVAALLWNTVEAAEEAAGRAGRGAQPS